VKSTKTDIQKKNNIRDKVQKPKEPTAIGGQAVIEGVMMRSPNYWAVAVRKPNEEIQVKDFKIKSLANRYKILKWPLIRGVTALIENLVIGIKALNFSANASIGKEKDETLSAFQLTVSFSLAILLVVGLFMAFPWFIATLTRSYVKNRILFTLIEGFIRIGIFVGYVYAISLIGDIRRVFEYHGAEHKAVNTFENNEAVNVSSIKKYSTVHVRCGTNFVLIVFIIAIFIFSVLPVSNLVLRIGGKLLLAPIIAGVAYEIIKKASKTKNIFIRNIIKPGLLLQKITTREPDEDQLKVSVAALNKVLELERNHGREVQTNKN